MLAALIAMTMTQDPPAPVGPLPSANQMAWHERQYYAFVHFGPNTFTGIEWGHGDEDPDVFNPTEFDARQWCRVFKDAGMSGVIITAKHHDGFALWPSAFTTHSVKASKWRGGKGDVLKDLSEACEEYGLWMGVYLSPWDRNHPTYGTDEYNDVFVHMLEEVLTNYGDMKEVWFDGANGEGPNGKRQVYDWPRFEATVRKYAPNAVIFGDGGDVRWVGNERGFVGETNWNFLPSGHWPGDQSIYKFLFEGDPNGDKYSPGECDVSIRPGWFWRESENDRVKNIEQLKEIFYRSIGHGGNLLLNVPPDSRGLIHESDVKALMEFRRWREETFATNLIAPPIEPVPTNLTIKLDDGRVVPRYLRFRRWWEGTGLESLTAPQMNPEVPSTLHNIADSKYDTYWTLKGGSSEAWFRIPLDGNQLVNHIVIQEYVPLGQRIEGFTMSVPSRVYYWGSPWPLKNTTIGYQRIIKFAPRRISDLNIRFKSRSGPPVISSVKAFLGLPSIEITSGTPSFIGEQTIELQSDNSGAEIRYTLDGSNPTENSKLFKYSLKIDRSVTLKAAAFYDGRRSFTPVEQTFTHYAQKDLWPDIQLFAAPEPGIAYAYIEQGWQTLDQMKELKVAPLKVSTTGLDLSLRNRDEHFGFRFQGVITAPKDGIYTFDLASDDGSRLYIDDKLIVDNDGLHGMVTKQGIAPLQKGFHIIRVEYFNATGGLGLKLEMAGPEIAKHEMKPEEFRQ